MLSTTSVLPWRGLCAVFYGQRKEHPKEEDDNLCVRTVRLLDIKGRGCIYGWKRRGWKTWTPNSDDAYTDWYILKLVRRKKTLYIQNDNTISLYDVRILGDFP